jgi:hypothetical protein
LDLSRRAAVLGWQGTQYSGANDAYRRLRSRCEFAKIKLTPSWPKKPVSNWNYFLQEGGKTLILRPLEAQDDLEPGCGYILKR